MHSKLWQHPNGTFYILYGPRLKKRLSTRTTDRVRAEKEHATFTLAQATPRPKDCPTVGEILYGYRDDHSPRVRSPDALKFGVQALHPRLGHYYPDDLLPPVIRDYAAKRGASDGTILREIGVLRAAGAWAVANKWLLAFPPIGNPVQAPKGRERWLSREEAKRLLAACNSPHLRFFVMLGLMTGARMGAILELQWAQVDFKRRLIDFGEGHGNKRRAIVPINDDLLRALKAAKETASTDFVVEYRGAPVSTVKRGFELACGRAKLNDVTPHILRHTCATWQVEAGVSYEAVGKMIGDTAKMVEDRYGHHSPKFLAAGAAALQFTEAAE